VFFAATRKANVSLIVELAKRYQVDAVFAGWGHASENPALPNTLASEGIVFMGPPGGTPPFITNKNSRCARA